MRLTILLLTALLISMPIVASEPDEAAARAWKKGMCKACHGEDGSGDTPTGRSLGARDLRSDEIQDHSDDELEKTIREGTADMPSYDGVFNEEEFAAIIRFIRWLPE